MGRRGRYRLERLLKPAARAAQEASGDNKSPADGELKKTESKLP
jgi:hypothetical protein